MIGVPRWKERKQKQQIQGKCDNCRLFGHKKADCWFYENNKDKRPKGWKSSREKRLTSTSSNDGPPEFILMSISNYQCSFGNLVVGREKRGPLVICDQCNWC